MNSTASTCLAPISKGIRLKNLGELGNLQQQLALSFDDFQLKKLVDKGLAIVFCPFGTGLGVVQNRHP